MTGDDTADDRTRAAIRAVADVPAPPVTTTLDSVVRRGRRRTLVQRGATVAAVVGVVAAIGVGGVLLRTATEGQAGRPAGPAPTTTPTTTTAPTAPTTNEQQPPSTPNMPGNAPPSSRGTAPPMALLPGWNWVGARITPHGSEYCMGAPAAPEPDELALPNQGDVRARLVDSVSAQTGTEPQVVYQSWAPRSPKTDAPRGYLEVNVDMGDGPGSVQLEVGGFGGSPTEAADSDVSAYGSCERPMRTTLGSGAVLQMYQPDYSDPQAPMQHFGVYLPGGRHYVVTSAGYGEADKVDIGGGGQTIAGGRGRLPLDAAGLAKVGEALAALGK
ncbi:MAG TPA: hypothetical protein VGP26_00270 [Actinophytocola sp.]|nr:hypothetical protein [Actinophytocola sp.]